MTAPGGGTGAAAGLAELDARITACRACPRLVDWRESVAGTKAAFAGQHYWSRPVSGFGPADARLAVVGLAPAAHGANRTGRVFTGDDSGAVLFRALHELGLASQPTATARDDGLELYATRVTSPVRCAPPQNRPTPAERDTCRPWLEAELRLLRPTLRAVVVLGAFGWGALLNALPAGGWTPPRPRPRFGHGAHATIPACDGGRPLELLGSFHVSRRNVQTGLLTPDMLRAVLRRARAAADIGQGPGSPAPRG